MTFENINYLQKHLRIGWMRRQRPYINESVGAGIDRLSSVTVLIPKVITDEILSDVTGVLDYGKLFIMNIADELEINVCTSFSNAISTFQLWLFFSVR